MGQIYVYHYGGDSTDPANLAEVTNAVTSRYCYSESPPDVENAAANCIFCEILLMKDNNQNCNIFLGGGHAVDAVEVQL